MIFINKTQNLLKISWASHLHQALKTQCKILVLCCFIIITSHKSLAVEFKPVDDLWQSLKWAGEASYLQFTPPSSWVLLGAGTAALWPLFNTDAKIIRRSKTPPEGFYKQFGENIATVFNFPLVSMASYYIASRTDNEKLKQYSMEILSAMFLAQMEASILSRIKIHRRPDDSDLDFWETDFRGESSFPSGHVVGLSVIAFKTFQFYGPLLAIPPAVGAYFVAKERVDARKHYVSDVVGGALISALASEGVRVAAKYKDSHPAYKWIVQKQLRLNWQSSRDRWIANLSWTY